MNDASFAEDPSLNPAMAGHVDSICDRFEIAWQSGQQPEIGPFLGDSTEPLRSALLKELLLLELHYRDERGETLSVERYLKLFPEHVELIKSLFAKTQGAAGAASVPDTVDWSVASTQDPRKPDDPAETATPEKQFGRFELAELLGRGGFGSVHRARDPQLHRDVALKFPRSGDWLTTGTSSVFYVKPAPPLNCGIRTSCRFTKRERLKAGISSPAATSRASRCASRSRTKASRRIAKLRR